MSVDFRLDDKEAQQLLTILWTRDCGPAAIVQPLIQKISKQLQEQTPPVIQKGNSDDVPAKSRPR